MGCGVSKIDSSKLTPFFHRNGNGQRNADTSVNLSKKELLKHEYHQEDQSSSRYHSLDETDNERSMASLEGSVAAKVEERKENEADNLEEKEEKPMLVKETDQAENRGANDDDDDDEEEEQRLSNSYLCPSSPSFRVYCVNQSLDNTKDDNESNKDVHDDECDQKLQGVDSREIVASMESNEEKLKEKGKKRFGRVMVKGKSGAVKNLMKVKSCYHPSRSHRQHSTQLLTHNASTA